MRAFLSATILSIISTATAQKVGTLQAEAPLSLAWSKCVSGGTCTTQAGKVVLDAEWRWLHYWQPSYDNCYGPGGWNYVYCPPNNPPLCAQNCALEGAGYSSTYGVTTSGNSITLRYVTQGSSGSSIGSRVFMLSATDNTKYEIWKLLNKELTFDVDASNLPCGVKGSLYFVEMDADGGKAKYSPNLAGAKYGTGYCDAKCNKNLWINGEANVIGWSAPVDPNYVPYYGSCCGEVDLFEGNQYASAFSAHPCTVSGQTRCHTGSDCSEPDSASGVCDADGCDWNSYRLGATSFYGLSKTVDTSKKFTVVTQFITSDGTDNGQLVEIKRFYLQNGVVIQNNSPAIASIPNTNKSIKDSFCSAQKTVFGETDYFAYKGGLTSVGNSLKRGGVLVFGITDDQDRNLQWLDGVWPQDQDPSVPGVKRGSCDASSGDVNETRASRPNASVTFSNVRIGAIGSTTSPSTSAATTTTTTTTKTVTVTTTTTTTNGALQTQWGQCSGPSWT
ncbi:hypothetical protein FS837_003605, partial [Tulasnella sp. UAMH 9824]